MADGQKQEPAGRWLKPTHFLTGSDDPTVYNVTFLSKPAEWHALAVGILAAVAPVLLAGSGLPADALGEGYAISYIAGRSLKDIAHMVPEDGIKSSHVKDALAEPAYTTAGYLLGSGVATIVNNAGSVLV